MSPRLPAGLALFAVLVLGFVIFLPKFNGLPSSEDAVEDVPTGNRVPGSDVLVSQLAEPRPILASTGPDSSGRGAAVRLQDLSGLVPGDAISLYVPQEDASYQGQVSDSNLTEAGNRVLTGRLQTAERDYRFVFTVGRFQTFGTFYTPKGSYQLETRDGVGRIVSGATIREGLDFSEPDYVLPERKPLPPEE